MIGEILGITAITLNDEEGQRDQPRTHLLHILVTECAHLIWRLRCKRVIQHNNNPQRWPTTKAIANHLKLRLNHRLRMDCILTSTSKFDKKAIDKDLVMDTWNRILEKDENRRGDWTTKPGVLVGSRFFEIGAPHPRRECVNAFPQGWRICTEITQ